MTAGYSGKPLVEKLGIKPGMSALIENAPRGYRSTLGTLPPGAVICASGKGPFEFIQVFSRNEDDLARRMRRAKAALSKHGMLWISWPKRSAGVASDLDENVVRRHGLAAGLVDVKVCAVDETWSGLKFVIPLKSR